MSAPLVRFEGLSRTFGTGPRAVVAVHDATGTVDAGGRIALVGQSGSGKSTLVHLLAGLDDPSRGSIDWPGLGSGPRLMPGCVGVVFQGPSLVPSLTAEENVALPLVLAGTSHAEALRLAADHLAVLGLTGLAHQFPDELSGGQAQRVGIARVLAVRPRLILADEPTGRLDQQASAHVVDVLVAAADEVGAGLLVATHDPHVAARLGTTWRMHDGAVSR